MFPTIVTRVEINQSLDEAVPWKFLVELWFLWVVDSQRVYQSPTGTTNLVHAFAIAGARTLRGRGNSKMREQYEQY